MNRKEIYYNQPQIRSMLIEPNEEYAIWGRGTGKSDGLIAPRLYQWITKMPRSTTVLVAATYQQHLTRTLPAILRGWERMGFVRDRDYFFGQRAPKSWKWPTPLTMPMKTQYLIHTRFGSGIVLASQDRPGSTNGLSIDAIAGDEAKFLSQEKFEQELFPAMRGNRDRFGHLSCHFAVLLASDMPIASSAQWLLEKEDLMTHDRVELILGVQYEMIKIQNTLTRKTLTESTRRKRLQQLRSYMRILNEMRRGDSSKGISPCRYYSEASSYENIHVLGVDYFNKMKSQLTDLNYSTSIENNRLKQLANGFYPDLDEDIHGYDKVNYSYLTNLGYDFERTTDVDSRQDGDVSSHDILDIALDYGGSLNCMVVGQSFADEYRFLKSMHVKGSEKLHHLITKFKKYYRHHHNKCVRYYYDHTAIGEDAVREISFFQEVVKQLRKDDEHGSWAVMETPCGQAPGHQTKFDFWGKLLTDADERLPRFRYNRHNCEDWAASCMMAPAKQGRHGIEKDKTSERRRDKSGNFVISQEKATHYSDAGDTLAFFAIPGVRAGSGQVAGVVVSGG